MEITNKVRKLIYGMFDRMIEGSDKYITDNSMWLIFTEEKRWIIEFTNKKTLWFNYNIFQSEFNLLSMDCVKSKDIIKEWFESRFLGIDVVEDTLSTDGKPLKVEDTIQNGVKRTMPTWGFDSPPVEDTIQNGVKRTEPMFGFSLQEVEDTIQNGVKRTVPESIADSFSIEDTIQNGVKTTSTRRYSQYWIIEDTIQNGVKTTLPEDDIDIGFVENAIQNGVKKVSSDEGYMNHFKQIYRAEQTIQNGIKE